MKKPRGEAILKNLPDALQERLWQFARRNTGAKTCAWLMENHGVKVSEATLSVWFSWYPRSLTLRMAASSASELEATLRKLPELKISAEQATQVAAVSFELQAAQDRDADLFMALQKGKLERARLALDERKVKLLEAKAALADQAKAVTSDAELTDEQKLTRFKQIFGA